MCLLGAWPCTLLWYGIREDCPAKFSFSITVCLAPVCYADDKRNARHRHSVYFEVLPCGGSSALSSCISLSMQIPRSLADVVVIDAISDVNWWNDSPASSKLTSLQGLREFAWTPESPREG